MKQTANQKEMVEREVDMNSGHAAGNEGMSCLPRHLGLFFSAALLTYVLVVEHRVIPNNTPSFPHCWPLGSSIGEVVQRTVKQQTQPGFLQTSPAHTITMTTITCITFGNLAISLSDSITSLYSESESVFWTIFSHQRAPRSIHYVNTIIF